MTDTTDTFRIAAASAVISHLMYSTFDDGEELLTSRDSLTQQAVALGDAVLSAVRPPIEAQAHAAGRRAGLEEAKAATGNLIKQAQAFGGDGLEWRMDSLRATYTAIETRIDQPEPPSTQPKQRG